VTKVAIRANAEYDLVGTDEFRHFRDELMQRYSIAEQERWRGVKIMRLPTAYATATVTGPLTLPPAAGGFGTLGPESGFVWRLGRVTIASSGTDQAGAIREPGAQQSIALPAVIVTTPTAGQVLATATVPIAGTYTVNYDVLLGGTLGAQDRNNVQLEVNGVAVPTGNTSNNGINSGTLYGQTPQQITVPAGATVTLNAIGAGTAASTYSAGGSITPDSQAVTVGAGVALYTTSDETQQARNLIDSSLQVGVSYTPGSRGVFLMPAEGLVAVVQATAGNTYTMSGQFISVPAEMQGKIT